MPAVTRPVTTLVVGIVSLTGALLLAQAPAPPPPQSAAPQGAAAPTAPAAPAASTAPAAPGTIVGTPANDPAKGAALLAEARKALGGDDKFKAIKALEVKGKSARAQQQATLQGDFEIAIEMPDKFRRKESLGLSDINVDIVQLLNGAEGSTNVKLGGAAAGIGGFEDGGGGGNRGRGGRGNDIARFLLGGDTSDDPEEQHKVVLVAQARMVMALLLTAKDPVSWVGVAESPDGRADVLEFKTADGTATRFLLDEKTHLPLMLSWTGTVQSFNNRGGGNRGGGNRGGGGAPPNFPQSQNPNQGRGGGNNNNRATAQQANLQMHLSDYKAVSGLKFPFLIQSGANNETTEELVVKNIRVNPSFKADLFTK